LLPIIGEGVRLRLLVAEVMPEGMKLTLLPENFWRERELCSREEWESAWRRSGAGESQERLGLVTEAPGIADVLAESSKLKAQSSNAPEGNRITVGEPESGGATGLRLDVPLNVQLLTPLQEKSLETLNVERLTGSTGLRLQRSGWAEPESEAEAMAACAQLLGGPTEMRAWGGRWRNRWRANAAGLRKVLNMVREEQANGRKPDKTWGAYATDLWDRFVERRV